MINKKGRFNYRHGRQEPALWSDKDSPCVRNCCLDKDDICLGCFRTVEEIMQWHEMSDEQKKQILEKAEVRKKNR